MTFSFGYLSHQKFLQSTQADRLKCGSEQREGDVKAQQNDGKESEVLHQILDNNDPKRWYNIII